MKLIDIVIHKIILLSNICLCSEISLIRKTESGFIRGKLKTSEVNKDVQFASFIVPFAEPPVGKLRFQEPKRPKPWVGVKNTTAYVNGCAQINEDTFEVVGSEDCLYLEVSEPLTSRNHQQIMPVFVYIHGGTFITGSLRESDSTYFMEKPIVMVSVQYRLNVFGFLTTGDHYAIGNVGLRDLQFALEWVQRNIKNFAGDPSRVTIGGYSAGSSAVHYLLLSPKSQKLFQRVINQSGTTLNRWSLQRDPFTKTKQLANALGFYSKNNSEMILNLQNVDYRLLIKQSFNVSVVGPFMYNYMVPFGPIIEPKSKSAFIDESTYSILEKGNFPNIPVLTGHLTLEGTAFYDYILRGIVDLNIFETHPELIIPISLNVPDYSICKTLVPELIRQKYYNNGSLANKVNWLKFASQDLFVQGLSKAASFISKKSNVYYYVFSFIDSSANSYFGVTNHGDELAYLFYKRGTMETPGEKRMQKAMVSLWSNFIITGNPTPKPDHLFQNVIWPRFKENSLYLNIDANFTVKENPDQSDVNFWNYMFEICGFPPYYTY
ncbi:hypothetical protein FQR65_LT12601 [Abscondita terminalis]|nr:hypothetical protein FQR65_LT12601 [Abscondita terminalis]